MKIESNGMRAEKQFVYCNLCRSNNYKNLYTKFGLNLVMCKHCGLVYTNPRMPESEILERYESPLFFEEYLKSLKANSTTYDRDSIRSHYYLLVGLIDGFFAPGKKMLDVGSGAGFFLKVVEEKGWKAEGIEISKMASDYANEILGVNVHNSKLEDAKFSSENYDLVTLLDTIEHLTDPLRTLKEIYRVLKNDGLIIVSTPDIKSLSRTFLGKHWSILSPGEHLYNFSTKTLSLMLSKANFKVLGIRNLLIFNPEYSHDKSRFRYRTWKKLHECLEKKQLIMNIHGFEYLDLIQIVDRNRKKNMVSKFDEMKRKIYKKAKKWLRGDMLVAVAKKIK